MTLDKLKEQNALEEQNAQEQVQEVEENAEVNVQEDTHEEEVSYEEEISDDGQEETNEETQVSVESEVPSYLQTEEDDEAKFTDSDIGKAKRKLKVRLSEKDEEIDGLKAEIERLKNSSTPQQADTGVGAKPTLEQFDYDESSYQEALSDWQLKTVEQRLATKQREQQLKDQQAQHQRRVEERLDSHYSEANELIAKGELTSDRFESAERAVRESVDSVMGNGDAVVDQMIDALGAGSAKVVTYLGVNRQVREKFLNLVKTNNVAATIYLGELKAKLSTATKKISTAPKPSAKLNNASGSSNSESSLKAKYKSAKTAQARFKLSQEGRKAGFNTTDW